jgi:glutamyl-tRNA synthetase
MKVTHFRECRPRVVFLHDDYPYDPEAVDKTLRKPGALDRLAQLRDAYRARAMWDAATLEAKLKETADELACKPAEFIHPARVAVSGRSIGPSLYHMLEVLGKARVLARFSGRWRRSAIAHEPIQGKPPIRSLLSRTSR